jgi:hypothetical protein
LAIGIGLPVNALICLVVLKVFLTAEENFSGDPISSLADSTVCVAQTLHPSFFCNQLTLKMTSHCAHIATMREPAVESPGDLLIPHYVAQTLHPSFSRNQLTLKMTSHCAHIAAMREPAIESLEDQLIPHCVAQTLHPSFSLS